MQPNDDPALCRCGQPGSTELHSCPYNREINDDPDTLCNCCPDCEGKCRDDI